MWGLIWKGYSLSEDARWYARMKLSSARSAILVSNSKMARIAGLSYIYYVF